ncbi:unnamed protein product, partial [Effrenium voratum]
SGLAWTSNLRDRWRILRSPCGTRCSIDWRSSSGSKAAARSGGGSGACGSVWAKRPSPAKAGNCGSTWIGPLRRRRSQGMRVESSSRRCKSGASRREPGQRSVR